jgi:hypothetical protein
MHELGGPTQGSSWHRPTIRAAAAAMSGTGGSPDAPEGPQDPAAATEADPMRKPRLGGLGLQAT